MTAWLVPRQKKKPRTSRTAEIAPTRTRTVFGNTELRKPTSPRLKKNKAVSAKAEQPAEQLCVQTQMHDSLLLFPYAFGPSRPANDRHCQHNQDLAQRVFRAGAVAGHPWPCRPKWFGHSPVRQSCPRSAPARWVLHLAPAHGSRNRQTPSPNISATSTTLLRSA